MIHRAASDPDNTPTAEGSLGQTLLAQLSRINASERRVATVLARLPADCLAFSQPRVAGRKPDFVVVSPRLGLLVIEVKGWTLRSIHTAERTTIITGNVDTLSHTIHQHPVEQARGVMFRIKDLLEGRLEHRGILTATQGQHVNRLVFPCGAIAALPQIDRETAEVHLPGIFPAEDCLCGDELAELDEASPARVEAALAERLHAQIRFSFPPLDEAQMHLIQIALSPRTVVSPALRFRGPPTAAAKPNLAFLDSEQEGYARDLGDGHRLLFGVAGSGKTVVLAARARLLSEAFPDMRILVVCYNVALAAYLRTALEGRTNIVVQHFDGLATQLGCTRAWNEQDNAAFGARLLSHIEAMGRERLRYGAILVDEAQDFEPSWFRCLTQLMVDPDHGHLVIVGDGMQNVYNSRRQSWASLGIRAQGRTRYLRRCYRSTREIAAFAQRFVDSQTASAAEEEGHEGMLAQAIDPALCVRQEGPAPHTHGYSDRDQEISALVSSIAHLIKGTSKRVAGALRPGEIALIYPRRPQGDPKAPERLFQALETLAPTVWVAGSRKGSRERVAEDKVKLITAHAAKGLQFHAVLVVFADQFETDDTGRRLFYTAMTRSEELLAITHTGPAAILARTPGWPSPSSTSTNRSTTPSPTDVTVPMAKTPTRPISSG